MCAFIFGCFVYRALKHISQIIRNKTVWLVLTVRLTEHQRSDKTGVKLLFNSGRSRQWRLFNSFTDCWRGNGEVTDHKKKNELKLLLATVKLKLPMSTQRNKYICVLYGANHVCVALHFIFKHVHNSALYTVINTCSSERWQNLN